MAVWLQGLARWPETVLPQAPPLAKRWGRVLRPGGEARGRAELGRAPPSPIVAAVRELWLEGALDRELRRLQRG